MTQLAGYGRLGKDPVRRTTKDGKLMVTASLAVGAVLASVDIAAFSSHGRPPGVRPHYWGRHHPSRHS